MFPPGFWQQPHLPLMLDLHFGCYAEAHSPLKPNRRRDVRPAIAVRDGGTAPTPPPESAPCGGPDPLSSSHRIGGIPPFFSEMVLYATHWFSFQKVSQGLCSSIQPLTKGWPRVGCCFVVCHTGRGVRYFEPRISSETITLCLHGKRWLLERFIGVLLSDPAV